MAERRPARAVPAATVLLVRDAAAGLEVFLVERHRGIRFAGGATAFPGGKVDPGDADATLRAGAAGLADVDAEEAALRVAAVREVFEESGILLARPAGQRNLLPAERALSLARSEREARRAGRVALKELVVREKLQLACDLLVPFAHWITPEFLPRRFDTHFFLAPAPVQQAAHHDGAETVGSRWMPPRTALSEAAAGHRSLMFPTRLNLAKLARHGSVAEALAAARREPVVTVLPRIEKGEHGMLVRIPEEAGYDLAEAPVDELVGAGR